MLEEDSKGTFDKLVAGLSSAERTAMLSGIGSTTESSIQFIDTETVSTEKNLSLQAQLKNESLFYKIMLWIRGFFKRQSSERVYSDDVLTALGRRIARNHPGLIDYKMKALGGNFYARLQALKEASDFFKPYMVMIEDNPGEFYVFLCSFITPDFVDEVTARADPFILDFDAEPTSEHRNSILRSLEDVLKNMNSQTKTVLYDAISSLNWLIHFCKLPFLHFMAQFTSVLGDTYTCPYRNATVDYDAFAAVFTNVRSITTELLESIFLFSQRTKITENAQQKDIERAVKDFLAKANQQLIPIQMFISSVPVLKVGKLVNDNYDWIPQTMEGAEAWFAAFRAQWRKILDARWNEWILAKKKISIEKTLLSDFDIDEFPVMENRPWLELWTSVTFHYELSSGLLSWFVNCAFEKMYARFNEVMMEGVFIRNEKRVEFSDGLNLLNQAANQMRELIHSLSSEGEIGIAFADIVRNQILSLQVQNRIDGLMGRVETEIRGIINTLMKCGKTLGAILSEILDDDNHRTHDILQNLKSIKGQFNREWRESLAAEKERFKKFLYYLTELSNIDTTGRS